MTRFHLLFLLMALASPLNGQPIRGAGGERTEAIWDQDKPLVVMHLDSLGNTLSLKAYAYAPESAHPCQITYYRDDAHWERHSYAYSGNQLLSVAVYGPSGLKDSLCRKGADSTSRAHWARMPQAPDPASEWLFAQEAARLCGLDSLLSADPLDGDSFLFGADGRFLSRASLAARRIPPGHAEPLLGPFSLPGRQTK